MDSQGVICALFPKGAQKEITSQLRLLGKARREGEVDTISTIPLSGLLPTFTKVKSEWKQNKNSFFWMSSQKRASTLTRHSLEEPFTKSSFLHLWRPFVLNIFITQTWNYSNLLLRNYSNLGLSPKILWSLNSSHFLTSHHLIPFVYLETIVICPERVSLDTFRSHSSACCFDDRCPYLPASMA